MDEEDTYGNELLGEELARLARETIESRVETADFESARARCIRVMALYDQGAVRDAQDCFHAALVLLYGDRPAHYDLSRSLAQQSAKMGEVRAWTLQAMAWDRWLLSIGKPQRFGTQIVKQRGRWSLSDIDETITDVDRAFYGVPPLYVQQQRVQQLQREEDQNT